MTASGSHLGSRALHAANLAELALQGQLRNFPVPSLFKIASAMIERAELPVQRNSTLKTLSAISHLYQQQAEGALAGAASGTQQALCFSRAMRAVFSPVPSP